MIANGEDPGVRRLGSVEYLKVIVTGDVPLDDQPVALLYVGTEIPAQWIGSNSISTDGYTWRTPTADELTSPPEGAWFRRRARSADVVTFVDAMRGSKPLRVDIDGNPESPKILAGTITVVP